MPLLLPLLPPVCVCVCMQADSEKVKSLTVLSQQRAKNIQIMINRFPAARHVKTAILGMDHSFFTMEIIEVRYIAL